MADKIAAVATGHARTGIGILRLSGDGCIEAAGTVFRPRSGQTLAALADHVADGQNMKLHPEASFSLFFSVYHFQKCLAMLY